MDSANGGHYPTSFKDSRGETWTLILDLPAIRRARSRTGFNLLNLLFDQELLQKFSEDIFNGTDCLIEILQPRLTELGISEAEFMARLNNEELVQDAIQCLLRSILNFSRKEKREAIGPALEKATAAANRMTIKALAEFKSRVETTDWDAAITGSIAASSSPASAESTPTDSASGNSA